MAVTKYQTKKGMRYRFVITVRNYKGERGDVARGGFLKKSDAVLAEAEYRKKLDGTNIFSQDSTLDEVFDYWIMLAEKKGVKPQTLNTYKHRYKKTFQKYFGKKKINKINANQLQECLDDISPRFSHLKDVVGNLSGVFKLAVEANVITVNPMAFVVIDKSLLKKKKEKKKNLTKDELKNYFEGVEKWLENRKYLKDERVIMDRAMISLLAGTGMRISELLALEWDDIDFDKQIISITKTQVEIHGTIIVNSTKTQSSKRIIPLRSQYIWDLLGEWKEKQKIIQEKFGFRDSEFENLVFYNLARNKRLKAQSANKKLEECLDYCNVPRFTAHAFRHTFVTILREENIDKNLIAMYVGHDVKNKNTTDLYSHFDAEYLSKVAEMADKAIVSMFY